MTVDQAISEIKKQYIRATKMKHIYNPLAWALYQVWKMADSKKPSHKEREST